MSDQGEWARIMDCVWKLAEAEGFVRTDDQGKPQLYCNREWLLEAYRRCRQELSGGGAAGSAP